MFTLMWQRCAQLSFLENQTLAQASWPVLVTVTIINELLNYFFNFIKKSPRDMCEVSNWISFFQRFQKLYLIQHSIKFCSFTLPPGVYLLWSLILIKFFSFCSKLFFTTTEVNQHMKKIHGKRPIWLNILNSSTVYE